MSNQLSFTLPDGSIRKIEIASHNGGELLSDLLHANGIELNYRCGGRGSCKGCTLKNAANATTLKACQTKLRDIDFSRDTDTHFEIPIASLHDRSVHGVTDFTLLDNTTTFESRNGVGLAIDVGTTTVAVALWNLSDGTCIGVLSGQNKQDKFGDNVLSRISHSIEKPSGSDDLKDAIIEHTITPLVASLIQRHSVEPGSIVECRIAANTVMLHTIVGESLKGFGTFPFTPIFLERRIFSNPFKTLTKLKTIELLPSFGPFVGSDITAGAIAAGIHKSDNNNSLLIDFGTNGEILLKANGQIYVTATAAGPAFEGGRLNCGKKAQNGVISSFDGWNGTNWDFSVIGGSTERLSGISGSAYIDWIANAHQAEMINDFGRFDRSNKQFESRVLEEHDNPELVSPVSDKLFVSEVDIAELAQAKGAIAAGILTLLDLADLETDDVEHVYICGGFGYHLNLSNATTIGLIPKMPNATVEVLGNSSLGGTSLLTLQPELASAFESLIQGAQVVELNQEEEFEDFYIDSLMIGQC